MTNTLEATTTQDLAVLRQRPAALKAELDRIGAALAAGKLQDADAESATVTLVAQLRLLPARAAALARQQAAERMRFLLEEQSRLHAESAPLAVHLDAASEHGQGALDVYAALTGQLSGIFNDPKSWPAGGERREEIQKLVQQAQEAYFELTRCQNERERLNRELRERWGCAGVEDVEAAAAHGEAVRKEFAAMVT